jgi:SAM-dependent methyltransferase
MIARYRKRESRLYRLVRPPLPLIPNPQESRLPKCEGTKLFIGGAGRSVAPSFLNLDLFPYPGVHVAADIHALPFGDDSIAAIECDAVLEHVLDPAAAVAECFRVLRCGGFVHIVVPFCHPFHAYPVDIQRWTTDGLRQLLSRFEILDVGIRTGPTATLLVVLLEYLKLLSPAFLRRPVYAMFGWILWPIRYLDIWLNKRPEARGLANHIYALARKPGS